MKTCSRCKKNKELNMFGKNGYCKECNREYLKQWRLDNKERTELHNIKNTLYIQARRKNDNLFRLSMNIRSLISISIARCSKVNTGKNISTEKILGCTIVEFQNYLSSLFLLDMSWENYGQWEIDHIIPISNAVSEEEVFKLNHYTNLQPLWKSDNRAKGNRV
jgi:hypothetical protein